MASAVWILFPAKPPVIPGERRIAARGKGIQAIPLRKASTVWIPFPSRDALGRE